jgi:2-polyprenyl-3-methyl-5-hydroxy-6-metoxy-1,4-benzoquinol methylase
MTTAVNQAKLDEFIGKVVGNVGAAMSSLLVVVGDSLGLYKALRDGGPLLPKELAKKAGIAERYALEWLNAQAAAGYLTYDPATRRYGIEPEQAVAFCDSDSPAYVPGFFQVAAAMWAGRERVTERFKSGDGLAWGEQHPCLFEGTARFFRSSYIGNLMTSWIPSLEGVEPKLRTGARVADVGCGLGASTILMAKAFPGSRFWGFDSHPESIEAARKRARQEGVSDRVVFEVASSTDYPGDGYDLIAHFDCLHDMQDPVGAARHARRTIAPDGTWMIVEPFASDRPEENHNPVGTVYYSASTMLCVPHSLSQGGPALGAQAGESRLRNVVVEGGGFTRFRRSSQTPFNLVLEARP